MTLIMHVVIVPDPVLLIDIFLLREFNSPFGIFRSKKGFSGKH